MDDTKKVLITDSDVPQIAFDILEPQFRLIVCKRNANHGEIVEKAKAGVDAIFWATKNYLDKKIVDAAGANLKIVATMSVGVDNIDVDYLKRRGIKLSNVSGVVDEAVADTAVLLLLAASRRLHEGRKVIETGDWVYGVQWMLGQDICGSTVGIVGVGGISRAIKKRLEAFGVAKFLCSGCRRKNSDSMDLVPFDLLIKESDFVISSCPLTSQTHNLFNKFVFDSMKRRAVFVNVGRSGVVNQDDLVEALRNGTIFAAGLDVMSPEPLPKDHELLTLPNCILLPHLGSATYKTRNAMAEQTAKNILLELQNDQKTKSTRPVSV